MSCMWCTNFYRDYEGSKDLRGSDRVHADGECRLNPVPVTVSGAHCCAHFRWNLGHEFTSIYNWYTGDRHVNEALKKARAEIKRLKESNKKLREKSVEADKKARARK